MRPRRGRSRASAARPRPLPGDRRGFGGLDARMPAQTPDQGSGVARRPLARVSQPPGRGAVQLHGDRAVQGGRCRSCRRCSCSRIPCRRRGRCCCRDRGRCRALRRAKRGVFACEGGGIRLRRAKRGVFACGRGGICLRRAKRGVFARGDCPHGAPG